jgi:hypothetical protein
MVEKLYLCIILSLKSIFEFFLFHKINIQQNKIRIMNFYNNVYMQNIIWSLLQDCVYNMNK